MTVFTGPTHAMDDCPDTFWQLVEQAATIIGGQVILSDDYGRSLTAVQLRDQAERVAATLVDLGVVPGSRVSWQLPTTIETMVIMGALARLGAVQNPIIPILRSREVAFIIDQTSAEFFLVPEVWQGFAHGDLARELAAERDCTVVICDHATDPARIGGALRLALGDPSALPPPPTSDEVRWLYFSSGTTADPKGVQHTDRTAMSSASGVIAQVGPRTTDINPLAFPIAHIGGITMLTAALLTGMRLVLFDRVDPETISQRMASHGVTMLGSAVPFFVMYMAAQQRHGDEPLFPDLRATVGGGAPVPAEFQASVRAVLGTSGIANAWGLTEFPVAAAPTPDDPPEWLDQSVGRPAPGVQVRVVDENELELGVGEEGELRMKGPQCFRGYLDPTLDADAFDVDGWFRSGDLGLVDQDGNVRITGRLKDLIIRNAENISALEIEGTLLRHPYVADVAVIGVPDERTGERVCAIVVPAPGTNVALAEVAGFCVDQGLARHKQPERLEIVGVLPRNSMGKVLKNELRREFGRRG